MTHQLSSAPNAEITPTRSRPIENYPQQIFKQSYGLHHHANSAANRNFRHELTPAVMTSAAKSQTCNISPQSSGSCNQSTKFINKRNHPHANDSPDNSHHHQTYLTNSVHGDNPSQEGLSSVAMSCLLSLTENAMQQAPTWKASSSLFTQVERLKAVGIPKTSKYSDTHTPMGICSLRTCVSLYAHYGPVYPSMLTTDPCVPYMLIPSLYIPQCSLRTCVSLYAHYGPVYPSMLTTDLYTSLCSLRACIPLYAH